MKLTKDELNQIVDFSRNATPEDYRKICFNLIENYPRIFLKTLNKKKDIHKDYFVFDKLNVKRKLTEENIVGVLAFFNSPSTVSTSCPKISAIKYLRSCKNLNSFELIDLMSTKKVVEEIMSDNNIN